MTATEQPHKSMPVKLSVGNWLGLVSIAASMIIASIGASAWLYELANDRMDRAELQYADTTERLERQTAEVSKMLEELRVDIREMKSHAKDGT